MANEELKKKIIEILEEGQTPVEYDDGDWGQTYFPTNEDVADALIAAGIGDVKETQHRTEVTEWALRAVSFRLTRMCYPECPKEWERLMIECEDHWKWQAEQVIAKKRAEKELAEEKKDE